VEGAAEAKSLVPVLQVEISATGLPRAAAYRAKKPLARALEILL